jgi:hypothetical protein
VFWTVNLFVMPTYPYSFTLPPVNKQDIPSDGVAGQFLGISAGGVLDWLPVSASGSGDLLAANNLSELTATAGTARTNLGLGTTDTPTFKNLVISTGSIATSAPVTISQTWNDAAVAFTALKVNAVSTASASGSLLLDLQEGGVSKLSVLKNGDLSIRNTGQIGTPNFLIGNSPSSGIYFASGDLRLYVDAASAKFAMSSATTSVKIGSNYSFGWSGSPDASQILDTILVRDSASGNTLGLRNSINPQTFNVYGTYSTSPSLAYSRLAIACDTSGNATLTTQSTGTAGTVSINGVPVGLGKGNISSNVAVGTGALNTNATGTDNVAVGFEALGLGTGPFESVAVGWRAAKGASFRHVSIGYGANQLGANDSVSIGWASMFNLVSGSLNVAVGRSAGYFISGGSTSMTSCTKSLFLGCDTKALGQGQENQIVIGYDATGLGSNTAVLGNASITTTALRGNVGIGTTAPSRPLTVVGNVSGVNLCLLQNTNSAGYTELAFDNDTAFAGNLGGFVFGLGGTTTPSPNEAYFFNRRSAAIFFGTNATERMRITAAGNVGIGTTAPSQKLDVAGAVSAGSSTNGYQLTNGTTRVSGWGNNQGSNGGLGLSSTFVLGWSSGADGGNFGTFDTILQRDGETDHLAMRRTTNGQKFSVYGTYPGADTWERFTITAPTSGNVLLGTYRGTNGVARGLELQTDGVTRMTIATNGIVTIPVSIVVNSAVRTGFINNLSNSLSMFSFVDDSTGTSTYAAAASAPLMRFGGTTDSFPAIARDGAGIKFTGAAAGSTSHIKVPPVAVTSLPAAATAGVGARAFVNDALAPVFGSAVANGGSAKVPVYSDGSAWYVG